MFCGFAQCQGLSTFCASSWWDLVLTRELSREPRIDAAFQPVEGVQVEAERADREHRPVCPALLHSHTQPHTLLLRLQLPNVSGQHAPRNTEQPSHEPVRRGALSPQRDCSRALLNGRVKRRHLTSLKSTCPSIPRPHFQEFRVCCPVAPGIVCGGRGLRTPMPITEDGLWLKQTLGVRENCRNRTWPDRIRRVTQGPCGSQCWLGVEVPRC